MKRLKTDQTFLDYVDFLHTKVKLINDGAYAFVFNVPKNKNIVAKVFKPSEDEAYFTYLEWCLKNQHNPYVPKIHDVFIFDQTHSADEIGIVFMERLKSISMKKYNEFAKNIIVQNKMSKLFDDDYRDILCNFSDKDWGKICRSKDRNLATFAKFMNRELKGGYGNDCHDGNIMLRGNQVVFTDVICV